MNPNLPHLPDDFYDAHQHLRVIRSAAHAKQVSPDAVLACVIGRVATRIPIAATVNGSPVNYAAAIVGLSGSGKSTSNRTARDLIPDIGTDYDGRGVGSGEGLIQAYLSRRKTDEDGWQNVQTRHAALFYVDEGESLLRLNNREGSTTMSTIRSMWSGDQVGNTNAQQETTRHLDADTYRFVFLVGLQPKYAAGLLADEHAGTPQRFVWVAAGDPDAPPTPPPWPGPIELPTPPAAPFTVDTAVRQAVNDRRYRANVEGGHADPYEAHAGLIQLRTAAILAYLLDGRGIVTPNDWTLAAMIVDNSRQVRAELLRHHEQLANVDDVNRQTNRLVNTDQAYANAHDHKVHRVAGVIMRAIGKAGPQTEGEVRRAVASRDRDLIPDVLNHLMVNGRIVLDGARYRTV